jgi:hypothetical protein
MERDRPHGALGYRTLAEFAPSAILAATLLPEDDGHSEYVNKTTRAGHDLALAVGRGIAVP